MQEQFQQQAQKDPAGFRLALQEAFGDKASLAQIDQLLDMALAGKLRIPANIQFVEAGSLGSNALGAYDASNGGSLYLDRSLLSDPAKLQSVFNEEMGHHLDALLGGVDAAGDEGAVFSRTLEQGQLSQSELTSLKSENDQGVIQIEGRWVQVEFHQEGGGGTGSGGADSGGDDSGGGESSSGDSTDSGGGADSGGGECSVGGGGDTGGGASESQSDSDNDSGSDSGDAGGACSIGGDSGDGGGTQGAGGNNGNGGGSQGAGGDNGNRDHENGNSDSDRAGGAQGNQQGGSQAGGGQEGDGQAENNEPAGSTDPEPEPEPEKKSFWSRGLDALQTGLDFAGFVPGLGAVPDLLNAGIHLARGNKSEAAISAAAAVPLGGDAFKAGMKGMRAEDRANDARRAGNSGTSVTPKEGIYEFPDLSAGGKPYVGQSGNISDRLKQHEKSGRLSPGTETSTGVLGGKTAREIARASTNSGIDQQCASSPLARSFKQSRSYWASEATFAALITMKRCET